MKKKNSLRILGIAAIVAVTGFMLLSSGIGRITAVPVAAAGDGSKTFFAVLGGGQVIPPVGPPATGSAVGSAEMTFNKSTKLLCYAISYTGLVGTETAAHLHTPAGIGANAPPVITISGGGPPPPGPSPLGSPKTGCVPLSNQQASDLKRGLFYFQLHSTAFPPGELRGQVLPVR